MSKINLTVILGAGASKDAGMPICSDLIDGNYYNNIQNEINVNKWGIFDIPNLIVFAKRIKEAGIPFEELLLETYSKSKDRYLELLKFYERALYIGECYAGTKVNPTTGLYIASYYDILAKILLRKKFNVTVISFNHDLWLEHAFDWKGFNYGTIVRKAMCTTSILKKRQSHDNSDKCDFMVESTPVVILKMHGSFNFLTCETCGSILIHSDWAWGNTFFNCTNCSKKYMPYYVPPLKEKDLKYFNNIWDDAAKRLQETHSLLIAGYSMPDYDLSSRKLISDNLNKNAEVLIIDKFARDILPRYSFIENERFYYLQSEFKFGLNLIMNGVINDFAQHVR